MISNLIFIYLLVLISKYMKQSMNSLVISHCCGNREKEYEIKMAEILEKELKQLNDKKQQEIDNLLTDISQYKDKIIKLEYRNKLNSQNEQQLNKRVRQQQRTIKQLESQIQTISIKREYHVIEHKQSEDKIVIEDRKSPKIIMDMQNNEVQLKKKIVQLECLIDQKDKVNKYLEEALAALNKRLETSIQDLNAYIEKLTSEVQLKDRQILGLKSQKQYLQEKIAIISEKNSHKASQPLVLYKIQHETPQIQPVYLQKPIQKPVIIQTEKRVNITKLIQPQRAVISRTIECSSTKNCKCDQQPVQQNQISEQVNNNYNQTIQKYEKLIKNYKDQRQSLLKEINLKNSEIKLMQRSISLNQMNYVANPKSGLTDIQVTVHKLKNQSDEEIEIRGNNPKDKKQNKQSNKKAVQFQKTNLKR